MPSKKNKSKSQKGIKSADIKNAIFEALAANNGKPLNAKQLAFQLGMMRKKTRAKLQDILNELVELKKIKETESYRYSFMPSQKGHLSGIIDITRHGYGFVSCEGFDEDVFISQKNTANAITGDIVKISLFQSSRGKSKEGVVVEILERGKKEFVGIIELSKSFAFFIPDNSKVHVDFFIPLNALNNAQHGEKVVVRLKDWPVGAKNPVGEVVRVLGKAGEHNVEMHAILEEYELPYIFPEEVNHAAEQIPDEISEDEILKRRDFRKILTFTIDPEDAKDYDDAISFQKIDNEYEIGVHIADVSYYVKPKSVIDKEAYKRGTSVYLVDRTVPMLPEKLSNNLCSLHADKDKLCFAIVFIIDKNGIVKNEWIGKTIIRSDKRFKYEEVQEILNTGDGIFSSELKIINNIAKILREKRYLEGSINFETDEVKFKLDEQGKPLEIIKKTRLESHLLIEDLMLLANKKVAEFVTRSKRGFVYRVHDAPNAEKLADFKRLAKKFGYQLETDSHNKIAQSYNDLLNNIIGRPEQNFLQSLAIRTMSKAAYSPNNTGHYGLAFENYTHFTSPIRRYPDLMVHRILAELLENKKEYFTHDELKEKCKHCSEREINAEMADRASIKYKQVEFMMDKIGNVYDGIISGVIDGGFFVEIIDNKCEGFVTASSIDEDFYLFDEFNYCLKGHNNHKTFTLGQTVRIKVVEANLAKRKLDFMLANQLF